MLLMVTNCYIVIMAFVILHAASQHWFVIMQHVGQHYSLPGGSIGKKYIDLLCDELQYLSLGTYHSERVIVFCFVMLQRDLPCT